MEPTFSIDFLSVQSFPFFQANWSIPEIRNLMIFFWNRLTSCLLVPRLREYWAKYFDRRNLRAFLRIVWASITLAVTSIPIRNVIFQDFFIVSERIFGENIHRQRKETTNTEQRNDGRVFIVWCCYNWSSIRVVYGIGCGIYMFSFSCICIIQHERANIACFHTVCRFQHKTRLHHKFLRSLYPHFYGLCWIWVCRYTFCQLGFQYIDNVTAAMPSTKENQRRTRWHQAIQNNDSNSND